MERVIALVASLPESSKMRGKLSRKLVEGLWNSLQHPPTSYYGKQFQYRTADGSNNVTLRPYYDFVFLADNLCHRISRIRLWVKQVVHMPKQFALRRVFMVLSRTLECCSIVSDK